ncbi:MAG: hypothetical protein ACXWZS_09775 [Gemmatirosa sp.]
MQLFRHALFQALLVTIIALWLLGGVLVSPRPSPVARALLAFAIVVALVAWWKALRSRDEP